MVDTHQSDHARVDVYRLLSACFCEPDRSALVDASVSDVLAEALAPLSDRAAASARRMAEALATATNAELRVEYARLFVGPFALPAPPYGSVYLEPRGTVMGESTAEVAELYASEGLRFAPDVHEAPDHIAAELEFLHLLAARELAARRAGRTAEAEDCLCRQREFLDRLLQPWVHTFCDRVRSHTSLPFYRHLSDCLGSFLSDCGQDGVRADEAGRNATVH